MLSLSIPSNICICSGEVDICIRKSCPSGEFSIKVFSEGPGSGTRC